MNESFISCRKLPNGRVYVEVWTPETSESLFGREVEPEFYLAYAHSLGFELKLAIIDRAK